MQGIVVFHSHCTLTCSFTGLIILVSCVTPVCLILLYLQYYNTNMWENEKYIYFMQPFVTFFLAGFSSTCPLNLWHHCKWICWLITFTLWRNISVLIILVTSRMAKGFNEEDNYVTHILWPTHYTPTPLWEILEWRVRERSPPPSSKHHRRENILKEQCSSLQYSSRDLYWWALRLF